MDGYAIVGAPGYCAGRLTELEELGVSKFGIVGPNFAINTAEAEVAQRLAPLRQDSRSRRVGKQPVGIVRALENSSVADSRAGSSGPTRAEEFDLGKAGYTTFVRN